jgi:hypothetical protein
MRIREGGFDPHAFGECFDVGCPELVVRMDEGDEKSLFNILKNVIEMWERLLSGWRAADAA